AARRQLSELRRRAGDDGRGTRDGRARSRGRRRRDGRADGGRRRHGERDGGLLPAAAPVQSAAAAAAELPAGGRGPGDLLEVSGEAAGGEVLRRLWES